MVRRKTNSLISKNKKLVQNGAKKKLFTDKSPKPNSVAKTAEKRRYRPGTRALMEIKAMQMSTKLLIPKLEFFQLVKEIIMELNPYGREPLRIETLALEALQEFAELYLTQLFEDSMMCAVHARRVTLMKEDMDLARQIGGRYDPINI